MKYTDLFNDNSDSYALARPNYPLELYQFIGSQCAERKRAWDCGCGNGQVAVGLTRYFDRVYATDISPNQIKNSFSHPQIQYCVSTSENTAFADDYFDLICVAQALHWMELDRFWPEIKRVIKPKGLFCSWGYCWTNINDEIDSVIRKTLLDVIEPYWAKQNKLLWNHYRDIEIPFKRIQAPKFNLKINWNLN